MPGRFTRLVAPVAATALLLTACGDGADTEVGDPLTSDSTTTTPDAGPAGNDQATIVPDATVVEVRIVGGAPEGGVRRALVELGRKVVLRVTSDVDEEVHVHGYDIEFPLAAGATSERAFDATIPGVFEVELHGSGREILKLQVG